MDGGKMGRKMVRINNKIHKLRIKWTKRIAHDCYGITNMGCGKCPKKIYCDEIDIQFKSLYAQREKILDGYSY